MPHSKTSSAGPDSEAAAPDVWVSRRSGCPACRPWWVAPPPPSLPRVVGTDAEGVEIMCRRTHGLQLAFQDVRRMSDWKQPKGQAGQKWRSRVQWQLCEQYDRRSLDENELAIPAADEEVRLRLEKKALFNKYLAKAEASDKGGDGGGGA